MTRAEANPIFQQDCAAHTVNLAHHIWELQPEQHKYNPVQNERQRVHTAVACDFCTCGDMYPGLFRLIYMLQAITASPPIRALDHL